MATKIVCIDLQHAELLTQQAQATDTSVVRLDRAVVIDVDPSDNRVPRWLVDGIGFTDDVTEYDEEALRAIN